MGLVQKFLTANEKRAEAGYDPTFGGDQLKFTDADALSGGASDAHSHVPASRRTNPRLGGVLELKPDLDQVAALASERDQLWTRLEGATFLTANEKRAEAGYDPTFGGDVLKRRSIDNLSHRFNPYHDELGRFTDAEGDVYGRTPDGTPVTPAQAPPPIDLLEEEARGGHTIREHVDKTPEELKARVRATIQDGSYSYEERHSIRSGSFPSLEVANSLVNATLYDNREAVAQVAAGTFRDDPVVTVFGSKTGIEAYASSIYAQPRVRDATAVGVYIRPDPTSPNGFTVISAYPRNVD